MLCLYGISGKLAFLLGWILRWLDKAKSHGLGAVAFEGGMGKGCLAEHLFYSDFGSTGGGHITLCLHAGVAGGVVADVAVAFAQANAVALCQAAGHEHGALCVSLMLPVFVVKDSG